MPCGQKHNFILSLIRGESQVAIWLITADCEKALDRYEGYPTLYVKKYISIDVDSTDMWLFESVLKTYKPMVIKTDKNKNSLPLLPFITSPEGKDK